MQDSLQGGKTARYYASIEIGFIVGLAMVPLFTSFPYRVNIFLSWEGAFRLSQGQIPFRDFGMPMGYMYWVIPAVFFKLFGSQLITLVKAQVFINIVSGLAFLSILKNLPVQRGVRALAIMVYVISFSFFNFWPWYNHTVIVYEMVGLAFLFSFLNNPLRKGSLVFLILSALFIFFSFFTKQDGGALAFILCCTLLSYHCLVTRRWGALAGFTVSFVIIGFCFIYPLTFYNFGYWFNHGQPPHTARLSLFDLFEEFFGSSQWIKFYLVIIGLIVVANYKRDKNYFKNRTRILFLLLTVGIIAEAAIIQVTSYTPPDNNIFFHSFAFVFIFNSLANSFQLTFSRPRLFLVGAFGILLWWSGVFWKYVERIADRVLTAPKSASSSQENVVNRKTFKISTDSAEIPETEWTYSKLKSFHNIYLPKATVEGINRFLNLTKSQGNRLRVLNMTELTPLAVELPYSLETGPDIPLWYHLGVGMFNRQAKDYEEKIVGKNYDFVLFEYVPSLNNFYPFRVRNSLLKSYIQVDSFPAPRRGDTPGKIEVYKKS